MELNEKIAAKIASACPLIEQKVIEFLAAKEIERRTQQVCAGFEKLDILEKDLKKLKPDHVSFSPEGEQVSALYSKQGLENKKRLEKKIADLSNAIEQALTKGGYEALNKLLKGQDDTKDQKSDTE